MKRRDLIKLFGISTLVGGIGLYSSCTDNVETKTKELTKNDGKENNLSERDKKIVNRQEMSFKDDENPTDFELKHTPQIDILEKDEKGFTEIKVTVGQKGIIHPTEENHWIDYLKLFADDNLIASIEYESGLASGFTSFKLKLDDVSSIKAQIACNIHGIWQHIKIL